MVNNHGMTIPPAGLILVKSTVLNSIVTNLPFRIKSDPFMLIHGRVKKKNLGLPHGYTIENTYFANTKLCIYIYTVHTSASPHFVYVTDNVKPGLIPSP